MTTAETLHQDRALGLNAHSARAPTKTQAYIATLASGPCPSSDDLHDLCTALHDSMVRANAPEMDWLERSFEDQADALSRAKHACSTGNIMFAAARGGL